MTLQMLIYTLVMSRLLGPENLFVQWGRELWSQATVMFRLRQRMKLAHVRIHTMETRCARVEALVSQNAWQRVGVGGRLDMRR